MKTDVMMERRKSINKKLEADLKESEEIKRKLFERTYEMSEKTHRANNKINELQVNGIRSMRKAHDLETRLAMLRQTGRVEQI